MAEGPAEADAMSAARAAMWDMITGYRLSQIVRVAAALSLAEHCAAGPVTAAWLATRESADPDATARFLRACAAAGLVECTDGLRFTATPLLMALHGDTPGSMRGFALALPAWGHWLPWGRLLQAVQTGVHQAPATLGHDLVEYYATAPEEGAAFAAGLAGLNAIAGADAARVIDARGARLAVDVGGANGALLHDLMEVNPQLRGVVLDLPQVAPAALAAAQRSGLAGRLDVVGGDFLNAVPAGGDIYLLRSVLHDWNDEACIRILGNCRRAMAPGGRVIVVEMILGPVGDEPLAAPSQDLDMLVLLGGRERTVAQFDALLGAAGLRRTALTPTRSPLAIIEAVAA
jgi:hypothetical protein